MNLQELETTLSEEAPQAPVARQTLSTPSEALVPPASSVPYATAVDFSEPERFKFVCGTAGTGKTFAVRELQKSDPTVKLVATTGIAAVNLGGESTTINAAIGYFDTDDLREKYTRGRLEAVLVRWARQGVTHWVLDECSMLDGHQLTYLVRAVNEANAHLEELKEWQDHEERRPKIRLTLVGDFAQLPPVDAPFPFERDEWSEFESHTTMLTEIKRQTDQDFIRALQAARRGDARTALEYFRSFIVPNRALDFPGTTIVAKNAEVDRHNGIKLSDLRTEKMGFQTHRDGKQRPEWVKNIPEELALKEDSVVMILANQKVSPELPYYDYVNGDIGQVVSMSPGSVRVKLLREDRTVDVCYVERLVEELQETKPGSGNYTKVITGTIRYMPIRVAYATTCHKSQGLTLDHVQLCFNDHFFARTPGMLYVALSRVRSPQGLRLVGNPDTFLKRCSVDEKVRRWL